MCVCVCVCVCVYICLQQLFLFVLLNTVWPEIFQSKRNSDFFSFQLHFILNFVLTEPKLTHGPVKISARLSSHFVMNIIIAKPGSTAKVNSAK